MIWNDIHGRVRYSDCMFGIEAEVENQEQRRAQLENNNRDPVRTGAWGIIHDGSLRNSGVEYVLTRPLSFGGCVDALNALFSDVAEPGRSYSNRTSVHVHVNVQDMTPDQILSLYILAGAFEPLMQSMVDSSRWTNLFCLPVHMCVTASECFSAAYRSKNASRSFTEILSGIGKYSSVNTGRLYDLGTIEFRAMHGTDDVTLLKDWLIVLSNLRRMALQCTDVLQCIDILVLEEENVRSSLFLGCANQYTGHGYCTYQEACASSLAMLSSAKANRAPAHTLHYQHLSEPVDLLTAVANAGLAQDLWRTCTRRDLGNYSVPPTSVTQAVAALGNRAHVMDCYALDGYVYWFAARQQGNLLCREVLPATVQTQIVNLNFVLRA